MNKQNNIDQEIDKTLRSLDDISQAKTDAFFYSRLQARLDNRGVLTSQPESTKRYGFAFSVAAVLLLIVLNLISLTIYPQYWNDNASSDSNLNIALTDDYELYDISYYQNLEEE